MRIKELYREYKTACERTNMIEEAWETDDTLEEAFDEAYKVQYDLMLEVIEELKKLTKCDHKTARMMMESERFETLINKLQ